MFFYIFPLIALLVPVSAFVPTHRAPHTSALMMSYVDPIAGALEKAGGSGGWDPLGLLNDADQERFDRLRYVETKHGRISMLAILGHMVTTAGVRVPLGPNEVKNGIATFGSLPAAGLAITVLTIGALELGFASDGYKEGLASYCESTYPDIATDRRKAVELNNGRAAMMGIFALMLHEKLPAYDGNPYIINNLLGAPVNWN